MLLCLHEYVKIGNEEENEVTDWAQKLTTPSDITTSTKEGVLFGPIVCRFIFV